jgi:hypothetical protein
LGEVGRYLAALHCRAKLTIEGFRRELCQIVFGRAR